MKQQIKRLYIYLAVVSLATAFATLSLYTYTTKVIKLVSENEKQVQISKEYIDWAIKEGYIK